jgi:hypothetical protein
VLASPAEYAEEAVRFKEQGWAAYKIHPPTRLEGRHQAVCEAVRRADPERAAQRAVEGRWSGRTTP